MKPQFFILLLFAAAVSACSGPLSPAAPTAAAFTPVHRFEAVSAGYLHTVPVAGRAEFRVDSTSIFSGAGGDVETARGFNLAVYNDSARTLVQPVRTFDTWNDPDGRNARELVAALDSIPDRLIVMIAVADESGLAFVESCAHRNTAGTSAVESALRQLGSALIGNYCHRSAWSMIAVKGEGRKDEQLSSSAMVTSRFTL